MRVYTASCMREPIGSTLKIPVDNTRLRRRTRASDKPKNKLAYVMPAGLCQNVQNNLVLPGGWKIFKAQIAAFFNKNRTYSTAKLPRYTPLPVKLRISLIERLIRISRDFKGQSRTVSRFSGSKTVFFSLLNGQQGSASARFARTLRR